MNHKKEVGVLYQCISWRLYQHSIRKGFRIDKTNLGAFFGRMFRVPKGLKSMLIEELLEMNVLKQDGREFIICPSPNLYCEKFKFVNNID